MFWPAPVNLFFSSFHGKAHSDLIDWINAWCQIKKSVWQESQYELVYRGMILFSTTCISEKHRRSVLGYISLFRNKARFMQYLMNVFPQNAKKMSMLTKIRIQGIHYVVQNEKKKKNPRLYLFQKYATCNYYYYFWARATYLHTYMFLILLYHSWFYHIIQAKD